MSLRGEGVAAGDDEGRKPTHVRNKEGRVFIATPHLLEKEDMQPIFDGDPEEIKKMNSNIDLLEKKGPPSHVKAKNGRVFVATPQLIERGDMEFLYDYNPAKADKKPDDRFVLSKANKQRIHDEADDLFGADISMDQGLKEMRAEFILAESTFTKISIAEKAMEQFGIIMKIDDDVTVEEVKANFKILEDSDEDFLNEIRAEQQAAGEPGDSSDTPATEGTGDNDQGNSNPDEDKDPDADSDSSDESDQGANTVDGSADEPGNETGKQPEG